MTNTKMGYATRNGVENFLSRVFPEVTDAEFNNYIMSAEAYINNYLGYNSETTTSGILQESIIREKTNGKIDNYGNLVIDVMHPPVNFDANNNPRVSLVEYNFGSIRVPLQLTDGSTNATNTLLEVSENRRKIIYPSIYFLPYLPSVTPTAKMNLYNLRDTKFWVDVSYVGGFQTVPFDIVQAANLIVGDMVVRRDNPNFAMSIRQGMYEVQYFARGASKGDPANNAIEHANQLLQPYIRYTW
jgi:hypothetical protein